MFRGRGRAARRGRRGGPAEEEDDPKDAALAARAKKEGKEKGAKPRKKMSKEALGKAIKARTSGLDAIAKAAAAWEGADVLADTQVADIAARYRTFLVHSTDTRAGADERASKDKKEEEKEKKDDKKKAAVAPASAFEAPEFNYASVALASSHVDMPIMSALAQMRVHLLERSRAVKAQVDSAETLAARAELLSMLADLELLKRKKTGGKGAAAAAPAAAVEEEAPAEAETEASLPKAVLLGVKSIFAFLARASESHPELCVEPLRILVDTLAGFAPQELRNDTSGVLKDVAGLFDTFAASEANSSAGAASLGATLAEAKAAALGGIVSLALAKGTLNDLLDAARALLAQVSVSEAPGSGAALAFTVPEGLQTLAKAVRGVHATSIPIPSRSNAAGVATLQREDELRGAPSALVCDGTHLYAYDSVSNAVLKIGSGFNDSAPGAVVTSMSLSTLLGTTTAPRSVRLALAGSEHVLLVATPDPALGAGVAMRLLHCATLASAGTVHTPYHGGGLSADSAASAAVPGGGMDGDIVGDIVAASTSDDISADVPVAPSAAASQPEEVPFALFSGGADGSLYSLTRDFTAADDTWFGRVHPSFYTGVYDTAAAPAGEDADTAPAADGSGASAAPRKASKPAARVQIDGAVYERGRPAGATKCTLQKFTLSVTGEEGGASAGKLKSEGSSVVYVPPSSVECAIGSVRKSTWESGEEGGAAAEAQPHWTPAIMDAAGSPVCVRALSSSGKTTVAVSTDGRAFYIGDGSEVGAAAVASTWTPLDVPSEATVEMVALARGCGHGLVVTTAGELFAAGDCEEGQTGLELKVGDKSKRVATLKPVTAGFEGRRVVYAAVADKKSAAVTADGAFFTWGADSGHGELGWSAGKKSLRRGGMRKKQPTLVSLPVAGAAAPAASGAAASKADADGDEEEFVPGLFDDELEFEETPAEKKDRERAEKRAALEAKVKATADAKAAAEAKAAADAKAVTDAKAVEEAAAAAAVDTPASASAAAAPTFGTGVVPTDTAVVTVALGPSHAVLITRGGAAWTLGDDSSNQCGGRAPGADASLAPLPGLPARVIQAAAGIDFTVLLCADGSVWSCGNNKHGGAGAGAEEMVRTPTRVRMPMHGGAAVIGITAAGTHAAAVTAEGALVQWGTLGEAGKAAAMSPQQVRMEGGNPVFALAWSSGDNLHFVQRPQPLRTETLRAAVIYASSEQFVLLHSDAQLPPQQFLARAFRFATADHAGDKVADFAGVTLPASLRSVADAEVRPAINLHLSGTPPPVCVDAVHGIAWTAGAMVAEDDTHVVIARFDPGADATAASGADASLTGRSILADPRFAIPVGAHSSATALKAAVALLGVVDALADGSAVLTTAPAAVAAPASGKKKALDRVAMEQVERFGAGYGSGSGWGMNGVDGICVKVTEDVYLCGVGLFGASDVWKGKVKITEGSDANGDALAETEAEVERKGTGEVTEILFDEPVLLSADVQYHMAQFHTTTAVTGWYCTSQGAGGKYEGGAFTVEHESGVTFKFEQTKELRNNGSGPTSGLMPLLYFKPASAVAAARSGGGGVASGSTASIPAPLMDLGLDVPAFTTKLSSAGVTSLLALIDWSMHVLETSAASPAGASSSAARFVLRMALRTLASDAQRTGAAAASIKQRPLIPTDAEIAATVAAAGDGEESDTVVESKPATPPSLLQCWLPADASGKATTLWEIDRALRRVLAVPTIDAPVLAAARDAYVAAFDTLYPSEKLKTFRFNQLLLSSNNASASTDERLLTSRLLDAVMEAFARRGAAANALYSSQAAARDAAVASASRSRAMDSSVGVLESKEEELPALHIPATDFSFAMHARSQEADGSTVDAGADDASLSAATSSAGQETDKDVAAFESMLMELHTQEHVLVAAASGAHVAAGDSAQSIVSALLAVLRSNTMTCIKQAALARTGAPALPPFLASSVKLLGSVQDEIAAAIEAEMEMPTVEVTADKPAAALVATTGPVAAAKAGGAFDAVMSMCKRFDAQSNGWGFGGSPDAVSFKCDTEVYIAGFGTYGGSPGEYRAEIRLIEGDGSRKDDEEAILAKAEVTWECGGDEIQEGLFDEPILIEADTQYTAYICLITRINSYYGNSGKHDVETDEGPKFTFMHSSADSNGTNQDSGQIPAIYFHMPRKGPGVVAAPASAPAAAATVGTKRVLVAKAGGAASAHARDVSRLKRFITLSGSLFTYAHTVLDAAHAASSHDGAGMTQAVRAALQADAVLAGLLPRTLAHIARIVAGDPVHVDTFAAQIGDLLSRIDAITSQDRDASVADLETVAAAPSSHPTFSRGVSMQADITAALVAREDRAANALAAADDADVLYHRAVVETEHPYAQAQRRQWDYTFPPGTRWMVVNFDAACATVQQQDCVSLFTDAICTKQVGMSWYGQPMTADLSVLEAEPDKKKRAAATARRWPRQAFVVPGNSLSIVFEAATDYVNNAASSRYGVRMTVTAHGMSDPEAAPLAHLERELAHTSSVLLMYAMDAAGIASAAAALAAELAASAASAAPASAAKPVAAALPGAAGALKEVIGWEWEGLPGAECDIEDSKLVGSASNYNSGAILSHGITSGRMEWEITVVDETHSQCTCLGVAMRDISTAAYQNPKAWMYRLFNGYRYILSREDSTITIGKVNKGDVVHFMLDMDAGTLAMSVNDGDEKDVFEDIADKSEGMEIAPCVLFYSTGNNRAVNLEYVRSSAGGGAAASAGAKPKAKAKSSKRKKGDDKDAEEEAAPAGPSVEVGADVPAWLTPLLGSRLFSGGLQADAAPDTPAAASQRAFLDAFIHVDAGVLTTDAVASAASGTADIDSAALTSGARWAQWLHRLDAAERGAAERAARAAGWKEAAKEETAATPLEPEAEPEAAAVVPVIPESVEPEVVAAAAEKGDEDGMDDTEFEEMVRMSIEAEFPEVDVDGLDPETAELMRMSREEAMEAARERLVAARDEALVAAGKPPKSGAGSGGKSKEAKKEVAKSAAAVPAPAAPIIPAVSELDALVAPLAEDAFTALRASFAAYLWHAGLVSDAMAAAAFLRFHPNTGVGALDADAPLPPTAAAADDATAAAVAAYASAGKVTSAACPPVLASLLDLWRVTCKALRAPLLRKAPEAAPAPATAAPAASASIAAAGAASSAAAETSLHPSDAAVPADLRKEVDDLHATAAEFSFRVRGGADNKKGAKADASVPKHIATELKKLEAIIDRLPMHITADMAWEKKKARNMPISDGDPYMVGPAKAGVAAAVGLGAGADEKDSFICATPFDAVRYAVHYYEVEVSESGDKNVQCIGLTPLAETSYRGHLGWTKHTMGYHGDDGNFYGSFLPASETYTEGDMIGVGYVPALESVFFTRNGENLGVKYTPQFFADKPAKSVEDGCLRVRPALTTRKGAVLIANFGQAPFACEAMERLRLAAVARGGGAAAVAPGAASAAAGEAAASAAVVAAGAASAIAALTALSRVSASTAAVQKRAELLLQLLPVVDADAQVKSAAAHMTEDAAHVHAPWGSPLLSKGASETTAVGAPPPRVPLPPRVSSKRASDTADAAAALRMPRAGPPLLRATSVDSGARPTATAPIMARHTSVAVPSAIEESGDGEADSPTVAANPLLASVSSQLAAATLDASAFVGAHAGQTPLAAGGILEPLIRFCTGTFADASGAGAAPEDTRVIAATLRGRYHRAERRKAAFSSARELLVKLQSPVAVAELLWALASAFGSSAGADDDSLSAAGGADGDAADGGAGAASVWKLAPRRAVVESPLVADLAGCGAALQTEVRRALHSVLDAVAEHLSRPAATGGVAKRVFAECAARSSSPRFSSARRLVQLLALGVWRLPLDDKDHAYLQNSVIFTQLRELMQSSESGAALAATAAPSAATSAGASVRVDVSYAAVVEVDTNKERLATLTDASTETYWEPENPSSARDINITLNAAALKVVLGEARAAADDAAAMPSDVSGFTLGEVAVFLDCAKDKERRVKTVTLARGATLASVVECDSINVPATFAGWLFLRPDSGGVRLEGDSLVLRLQFTGPAMPRVRGLRVYAVAATPAAPSNDMRVDAGALAAFRTLASQVFAGLGSDATAAASDAPAASDADILAGAPDAIALDRQGSELRQRLAGMLFDARGSSTGARGPAAPLAGLQERVLDMVAAELATQRDRMLKARAWTRVASADVAAGATDAFCYELVSMIQALSASPEGAARIARPALFATIMQLFPVTTPRVQRSIIYIMRRVLPHARPDFLDSQLRVPRALLRDALATRVRAVERGDGADALTSDTDRDLSTGPGATVAYLLLLLARSQSLQVRGRAAGRAVTSNAALPDEFMPGAVDASVAEMLAGLLRDLYVRGRDVERAASDDASPAAARKGPTFYSTLRSTIVNIMTVLPGQMEPLLDAPAKSAYVPSVWLALAGLHTLGDHANAMELPKVSASRKLPGGDEGGEEAPEPFCDNHADGKTLADFTCAGCVPDICAEGATPAPAVAHLCQACDSVLHLGRTRKAHTRTALPSRSRGVETQASLDYAGGCGRFKLPWLQASLYEQRCRAMLEFKRDAHPSARFTATTVTVDRCRFCDRDLTPDTRSRVPPRSPALENVCNDESCEAHAKASCARIKDCGHACGGVCDEAACLPCYQGCDGKHPDPAGHCTICYDTFSAAPTLQLECGHPFHAECMRTMLGMKWNGPRITFGFMDCPMCKTRVKHPALADVLTPLVALEEVVQKKALMRLNYENLEKSPELTDEKSKWYKDPLGYAMYRFAYYMCFKCKSPYYGGEARCGVAGAASFKPEELVCSSCLPHGAEAECPKHGREFIIFKCRFCCSESLFFCFGTTHFCDECHNDPGGMQDMASGSRLPHCPAGPKGKQLPGTSADCTLKTRHPEPGEEFALGCSVCRNAATF